MAEMKFDRSNFSAEVLEESGPVLVDFWASWCGPCMMMAPVVHEIAEERAGRLKVGKVNVDEEPELAMQYGISGIPTMILFENGKPVNAKIGYVEKQELEKILP